MFYWPLLLLEVHVLLLDVATFQLGTPARDFLILMDSGSSDFWVGSEICRGADGGGLCFFFFALVLLSIIWQIADNTNSLAPSPVLRSLIRPRVGILPMELVQ